MNQTHDHLHAMRHSTAHVLAAALTELYPGVQLGVGPVIENGFFYDVRTNEPIREEDLPRIEEKMREIVKRDETFTRSEMPIEEAIVFFEKQGQPFKVELLRDLKEKGTTAVKPEEQQDVGDRPDRASVYHTGAFVDLCRGPHVAKSSEIGAFALTRLAGAYWRGSEKNPQLQRIYGVAFETQSELDGYLHQLEEAKKRDHRKLGRELGLFVFSDLVGPGLPLWTPRGTVMREMLDAFVWALRKPYGYERVTIPHITKKELYETSGHWVKFANDLFKIQTREEHLFAMKPMNCPHHAQIYASELRSYRDLPVRYAETTMVYRDEQSGELSGLQRVLSITQDDAHVFCRISQVREEAEHIWDIIQRFYLAFGFELTPRLSRRDPAKADKYLGSPEDWENAEQSLKQMLEGKQVSWMDGLGEAAFYGPKIDFMAKDSIGRVWQVATIQIDFNQPKNFGLTCVNEAGEREPILMVHAAIMGSIERFMSVIIEHFAGAFPFWLAPVQIRLATVGEETVEAARELARHWKDAGLRVEVDDSDEKVGKKIRAAAMQKVPWTVVFGKKELEGKAFNVNVFGSEQHLEIEQSDFVEKALELGELPIA